ncbi:DUF6962 family protein [candidate division KSB1 bacterium]
MTDILLGIMALFLVFNIFSYGRTIDIRKVRIWLWAFGLLALASFLGAVAHGIVMTNETNFWIWQPINLFLGMTVAFFVIGVVYDKRNYSVPKGFFLFMITISIGFFIITIIIPGSFLVFIIYEAVAMIFALVSYIILVFRKTIQGAKFMVAGIFLSIIAAVIQSTEWVYFKLIWEFDYNGIFHIIQIFGLGFLLIGLRKELLSRKNQQR